jgi:hypothetical protein
MFCPTRTLGVRVVFWMLTSVQTVRRISDILLVRLPNPPDTWDSSDRVVQVG